jgi:sterol 24-C-methyltransferase
MADTQIQTPTDAHTLPHALSHPEQAPSKTSSSSSLGDLEKGSLEKGVRKSSSLREKKAKFLKKDGRAKADKHRSAATSRLRTICTSSKYLYNLTPEQIDNYMASYVIYSLDWADEKQMVQALGPDYSQKVGDCLRAYYGVLNHLCALGDVEKMYIPPLMDIHVSVRDNQLLYEESIARDINLKPGDKVLDLGCGRGRVAAHMATFSGAKVTGINIDPNQVAQARTYNDELKLENTFVEADFNNLPLPFADDSFDACYQIQALSLCKDLPALFSELFRVLKPGAKFSILDWVSLPDYDPTNARHAELMRRVKPLIGAVGTPTPETLATALNDVGFAVRKSDNASVGGLQAPLIAKVDTYFRTAKALIKGLVGVKVLPAHFRTLMDRLCLDGEAFVEMDTQRLVTTSYRIIAEKKGQ